MSDYDRRGPAGRYGWWMLAGLAAVVLLGCRGFALYSEWYACGWNRSDCFYLTVQLFIMQSGALGKPVPWTLEVSRYLAAMLSFGALVWMLAFLREQISEWRRRMLRDHVILCGAGAKGSQLAADCLQPGRMEHVVLIDRNRDVLEAFRAGRESRLHRMTGDATRPDTLRRAGLGKARQLICVTGDDDVNVEIAQEASALLALAPRRDPLKCYVHIVDWRLCQIYRRFLRAGGGGHLDLEFVNVFEKKARVLLRDFPPDRGLIRSETDPRTVHLLIVGFGQVGEGIAVQAALTCHYANHRRLLITVLDRFADEREASFFARHPSFRNIVDIRFVRTDALRPDVGDVVEKTAPGWRGSDRVLSSVYVSLDEDSRSLMCAMALATLMRRTPVSIFVRLKNRGRLAALLRAASTGPAEEQDGLEMLRPFGLTDGFWTLDELQGGVLDAVARRIHENYLQAFGPKAGESVSKPVHRPWEQLDPAWRTANRAQADHIDVKLRAVGCHMRKATENDASAPPFAFTTEEVDMLARMEHDRWMAERWMNGWTRGPRNDLQMTHPSLVPWEELSETEREKDRDAVRKLPALLRDIKNAVLVRASPTAAG